MRSERVQIFAGKNRKVDSFMVNTSEYQKKI